MNYFELSYVLGAISGLGLFAYVLLRDGLKVAVYRYLNAGSPCDASFVITSQLPAPKDAAVSRWEMAFGLFGMGFGFLLLGTIFGGFVFGGIFVMLGKPV